MRRAQAAKRQGRTLAPRREPDLLTGSAEGPPPPRCGRFARPANWGLLAAPVAASLLPKEKIEARAPVHCAGLRVDAGAQRPTWEVSERLEDCGTGNNDSRLQIGAHEVRFYESGGRVRGAFLSGPYEIIIVLDMSGEGHTWMASHQFTLASDGSHLSSRSEDGSLFTRYRCPGT